MSQRSILPVFVLVALASLNLVACGNEKADTKESSGEVAISLTDASGDFLSYEVDIEGIDLYRANGAVVHTLPLKTRVDLVDVTTVSEFITAATVPSGAYTKAVVAVNFAGAVIEVEGDNGQTLAVNIATSLYDAATSALLDTTKAVNLEIQLSNAAALAVAPGLTSHLSLDFDLAASNQVDPVTVTAASANSALSPKVTVQPTLVAAVSPTAPKQHRVRGPLASVDTAANTFKLSLQPFGHQQVAIATNMAGKAGMMATAASANMTANPALTGAMNKLKAANFGGITVTVVPATTSTATATVFEIDGTSYSGSAGLNQLALPAYVGTGVIAIGDLNAAAKTFTATQVYAGTSVPGGTQDVVRGIVTARSGDDLTVAGHSMSRSAMAITRGATTTVKLKDVSNNTAKVLKQAVAGAAAITDISVGQQIEAFGTLSAGTLDASQGLVRMLVTSMSGEYAGPMTGGLSLEIYFVEGRPVKFFNFNLAGTSAATKLTTGTPPFIDNYTASFSSSLGTINSGDPVRILGFVQPFGTNNASGYDFEAQTVVTNTPLGNAIKNFVQTAKLAVTWVPPSDSAFKSQTASGLTLDKAKPLIAQVAQNHKPTDLKTLSADTLIVPATSGATLFTIRQTGKLGMHGSATTYASFTSFQSDLATLLGSKKAVSLSGMGTFDAAASPPTFTANSLTIVVR